MVAAPGSADKRRRPSLQKPRNKSSSPGELQPGVPPVLQERTWCGLPQPEALILGNTSAGAGERDKRRYRVPTPQTGAGSPQQHKGEADQLPSEEDDFVHGKTSYYQHGILNQYPFTVTTKPAHFVVFLCRYPSADSQHKVRPPVVIVPVKRRSVKRFEQ
ncbi:unnamed protein product [Gadus morhua 'NCC']